MVATTRERELAEWIDDLCPPREQVERRLVEMREDILRPFDELRRDMEALGDGKIAGYLDELLRTARGRA